MCIQKDILDPSFLDEQNKAYLSDSSSYMKIDSNGYDLIMNRPHVPDIEEIKPIKLGKNKVVTEYDNELKRRRQELLKKMRRSNEPPNSLAPLIRKIAQSENDGDKIILVKEVLQLINSVDGLVPQTKFSDQMINILELCLCDSACSEEFIIITGQLMMTILHNNIRRGDSAVVEFWCRIFDKMTNLQIEQYTLQILKMLLHMLQNATDGIVASLKSNRDQFLQNWEYFFENLCFPKCLNFSLIILRHIHTHCADAVTARFHNVIDIMIGWCIHPDTDVATMAALSQRSVDLHDCWLSDPMNLKKTLTNLQKDILSHCQQLSRIHRIDKDRAQVDELKSKIKFYCFALSCVTAGISKISDISQLTTNIDLDRDRANNINLSVSHVLPSGFVAGIIEKLAEGLIICSKQIDFDNLLLQSNTVILHLVSILNDQQSDTNNIGTVVFQCIFRYVFGTSLPLQSHIMTEGSSNTNYHNRSLIISYIDLISICLARIHLEPSTVVQILSPINWIHSCIFYGTSVDHRLLSRFLRLVDIIARSQCVTTFYQILLSDLELALNTLIKSSSPSSVNLVRLVQSNAFKSKTYEPAQAELVLKYNIDLIVLLHGKIPDPTVLVPAVPILFTKYLLFTEPGILEKNASVAIFIMRTVAKLHPAIELISDFLKFLCLFLNTNGIDFHAKTEAFAIFQNILKRSASLLTGNNGELLNLVLHSVARIIKIDPDQESVVQDCLSIVIDLLKKSNESSPPLIDKRNENLLISIVINMSSHTSYTIRCHSFQIYFQLLTKRTIPLCSSQSFSTQTKAIQSISTSGRSFRFPIDFSKSIFQWIIEATDTTTFNSPAFLRLHDLVLVNHSNTNNNRQQQQHKTNEQAFSNRLVTVYAIILNACWDCVRQKLKFDSSTDSRITLMTMENMVKSILTNGNSLKTTNLSNNSGSSADKRFRKSMASFATKSPSDQSVTVNLLILLLDNLEKLFYNSFEGCCIGFPAPNKSTETFFVTNRTICVDWFIKMRLLIVALAQYAGQWSTVVWHGMQLLKSHLDRLSGHSSATARLLIPEVEDCIVLTSMALSKLGNRESLIGLRQLAVDTYGPKFEWLSALADKSTGRIESALHKFQHYISTNHDPERAAKPTAISAEMRLLTRQKASSHSSFILCMEEIADCCKLLSRTNDLLEWRNRIDRWKSDSRMPEAQKTTIDWDRLVCLTKLSQWTTTVDPSEDPINTAPLRQSSTVTWKYRSVIDHCENVAFLSVVDKTPAVDLHGFVSSISSIQSICDFPSAFTNPDIILINERMKIATATATNAFSSVAVETKNLSNYSPTLPLSAINFCNAIQKINNIPQSFDNQRYLIRWHRKHRNFNQCQQLVNDSYPKFLGRDIATPTSLGSSQSPIVQMQLDREFVKLLWHRAKHNSNEIELLDGDSDSHSNRIEALKILTGSLRDSLLFETSDPVLHATKCQLNTKSLLTLFSWLCRRKSMFPTLCADDKISSDLQFLTELAEVPWISGLPLVSPQHRIMDKSCSSTLTDVCSQILILASKSHSTNTDNSSISDRNATNTDKSFMTLAHWCLNRSRSLDEAGFNWHTHIDASTDQSTSSAPISLSSRLLQCVGFTTDIVASVELLLKTNFCPSKMTSESDWFGDCYEDPTFVAELRSSVLALDPDVTEAMATEVMQVWLDFIGQHFSLHVAAAEAYFSFLKEAGPSVVIGNYNMNSNSQSLDSNNTNKHKTTANLRILSLLGKRSRLLRDSIIAKIQTSPPSAWQTVVPQLFARLKHSDKSIRNCMTELLQRLAVAGGSNGSGSGGKLIIYPTLVGAINEHATATSPYHEIRRVLVDNNRQLVEEVTVFIRELRRITVLWDELWVSALGHCYEELSKKAHQLQAEIDRIDARGGDDVPAVAADNDVSAVVLQLKYNAIIQPAVFILERTRAATDVVPETPRECWFHNMFSEEIASTIAEIKSPNDIREFNDAWKKIKDLQEMILTESNNNIKIKVKRGRHHFLSLKLDEVSPSLSKINASLIPLPGMIDKRLMSIDGHISILPTKTKPKKFHFLSTDGKGYNYLYKGLEDLRLDERVMQILGIANTMFSKLNEREPHKYHITTYPVTPLGTRAGLIQMVEDATSLFSLYKRHQMRNKTAIDLLKSRVRHSNNNDPNEATIVSEEGYPIRPTDIYWQKLRPKLESAKIDLSFDNRDKWPLPILTEVLTELNKDTPPDLLSKELWCCSINSSNWYNSSINFTRSCAIMSIMGHLLGLGDRHLDNLLVNFSTGQMVHIDYNVCFDKGVSLKVPEKVPFRLTDIITFVFGPMGVDGLFKISAENVYRIVQQSQDSILTLMDTFIFDPIVDWSSGIESGHYGSFDGGRFSVNSHKSIIDKRSVEFLINLNGFQSVLVTMEDDLSVCRDKLLQHFTELRDNLHNCLLICHDIEKANQSHNSTNEMIQLLRSYEHDDDCKLIDKLDYVRSLEARASNLEVDIRNRSKQLKSVNIEHSTFFNKILSTTDFISLKLDIKTLKQFVREHIATIEKSLKAAFADSCVDEEEPIKNRYLEIFQELEGIVTADETIDTVQECCLAPLEKYRNIIQEMPQSFFSSDRCSYMLKVTEQLVANSSASSSSPQLEAISDHLSNYSTRLHRETEVEIAQFHNEKSNWSTLLKSHSESIHQLQSKIVTQSHDDEIQELEQIWQLTMFENVAGINMFKAVLLEQYMEMANITSQLDNAVVSKIPESISLAVDYNATVRKYLQLLNAHENYFKILTNSINMFSIYLNTSEAGMVCNMTNALQKTCMNVLTFESQFIDIILPESLKIMKNLSPDDVDLLHQMKSISTDAETVLLHFNIAVTSTSYDINNYDNIHRNTVLPLKQKIAQVTDISIDATKQLRILIASFYTTIHQTYQLACDFIDCCMNSSTPSSWNYIDLVAASSINISPIWNKSIKLLKDALYMSGMRCLVLTLDQCRSFTESLRSTDKNETDFVAISNNLIRNVDIYFNFINKHILTGVGSQCFGKMFCLLLEHAGWNIDTLIAENLINNCALNAEFICGSVVSFRKSEYPNAVNFYTQLQYRFNNYKSISGFSIEPNLSTRFLSRNIAFHKSLSTLARNQLVSHCWAKKHLLLKSSSSPTENTTENSTDIIAPLLEMIDTIEAIPDRLGALKKLLHQLEVVNGKFQSHDEENQSPSAALTKFTVDRSQSINSLKKRILLVNDVLLNIDRFECLRSQSQRGEQFDTEVMEFLSDSKSILEKLNDCRGMISATEEHIVQLKHLHNIDNTAWWIDLLAVLNSDIKSTTEQLRDKQNSVKSISVSFEREAAKSLKATLSEHFNPIINQLKPSLRPLHNVTKKLKNYLSNNTATDGTAELILQTHPNIDRVARLADTLERFNCSTDSIGKFLLQSKPPQFEEDNEISEYIDRLCEQIVTVDLVRDCTVSELFCTLLSLSPLSAHKQSSLQSEHGTVPSSNLEEFRNTNMATATADSNSDGVAVSPLLSANDDRALETNKNQGITTTTTNIKTTNNNQDKIDKINNKKLFTVANSVGVQKAIEVWKLIENRLNLTTTTTANGTSSSSGGGGGGTVNSHTNTNDTDIDTEGNKLAIGEYVERLIKSARSADNLARMYEGWTAWV